MIVVADSGPLHYLILREQVDLLRRFYSQVLVPQAVANELSSGPDSLKRIQVSLRLIRERSS